MLARVKYTRPFSNKISLVEEPLEPEPRVKREVPKPEPCEDPQKVQPDYDCALDKLGKLDKIYKDKNFGFYGKHFRSTHASSLNFFKYRKTNPVGHPNARLNIDENSFMEACCELFFEKPTLEEFFHMKTITFGCEDHRLKMLRDQAQEKRSSDSMKLCEERNLLLEKTVDEAGKDEYAYDDLVSDITEPFLSGERMARNPESLGSSSKSLTTLFWNLGNWSHGKNWLIPSFVDPDKLYYKENHPQIFPDHVPENNSLFLQMLKNLRAHIMLVCEAGTLVPHRGYLESHGWTLCFHDAQDLRCLARLGKNGSIVQIAGPQEDSQEDVWKGPNRRVTLAIFEITWAKAIPRSTYAASSTGYFDRNEEQDFEDMTRARMPVTRTCVYHVDNVAAGRSHAITGEIFAHMMYECVCHQVSMVGGGEQAGISERWTAVEQFLQYVNLSVLDGQNGTHLGLLLEERFEGQQGYECKTVPFHFLFGLEVSS